MKPPARFRLVRRAPRGGKGRIMKKVTFFYVDGCPYCKQARETRAELVKEHPEYAAVEFDEIEESEHPEIADNYDYQATPTMFIGDEKIYESHLGEKRDEAKRHVEEVLKKALEA